MILLCTQHSEPQVATKIQDKIPWPITYLWINVDNWKVSVSSSLSSWILIQDIIRGLPNHCLCLLVFRIRVYFRKVTVGWLLLRRCLLILGYLPSEPLKMLQRSLFSQKRKRNQRMEQGVVVPTISALGGWGRRTLNWNQLELHCKTLFQKKMKKIRAESQRSLASIQVTEENWKPERTK